MTAAESTAGHALLLSGSLGMGHDVTAAACAGSLERRGWSTTTLDSLRLLGRRGRGVSERVFRALLAAPGAYDAFHFDQLRGGGVLARLAESASSRYAVPALREELDRRPTDLVVSLFATGAGAASTLKRSRPDLRSVVFCTDACPHRLWVHDNTDLYLVTSRTAVGFVHRFHPGAQTVVVPSPVRSQFYAAPTQAQARAELGIPASAGCVLLMSGSWGLGPLVAIAKALASAGVYTLAVAGHNEAAARALRQAALRLDHLVPFGFSDRIPTLMAACDLVVTSSGDTCSEARVIGRHPLLLDVVPGHGRENLQQELERGDADAAPNDPDDLCRSVLACLDGIPPPVTRIARGESVWEDAFGAALGRLGLADSPVTTS